MSTNEVDIEGKIVTMLGTISMLNGVYNYIPAKPTNGAYPFATVEDKGGEAEFGDTIRNIRTYLFEISIWQEQTQTGFGNSKAASLIRQISDQIITTFDNNTTLDGMVKWVKPLRYDKSFLVREVGDVRVARFTAECVTVVPSTT